MIDAGHHEYPMVLIEQGKIHAVDRSG